MCNDIFGVTKIRKIFKQEFKLSHVYKNLTVINFPNLLEDLFL